MFATDGYTRVTFSVRSHTSHAIAVTLYCGQCKQGIHAGEPVYLESPAKDPEVFRANLTPEDMEDIEAGRASVEHLRCAAESMSRRLGMEA